ncbi:restriction endonuclease [Gracilimonas mengyeensis]|uniref:ATP cone domain-containing protein n=1 Tax=Gracilimonas mengyeensis TaxID=1302730 RepID=A0A521CXH5_9BACT|nr:restriction endonuclease [Gracilimonas mengyeensis]SMO64155.1 ATP cone domain-containing protein [Gracilimonas mengyeensis]
MESFEVVKANGEREIFQVQKLRSSLSNAGAGGPVIKSVIHTLEEEGLFRDGITTQKIYREAYRLLKKRSHPVARRYRLKEALFEMGPSGYPFEVLVSELFKKLGYQTKVGKVVQGKCVSHEIDVIATDDRQVLMVECKFHNRKDHNSSIQTPLYIQSRFLDVRDTWESEPEYQDKEAVGYIVTNTRFTGDALDYAKCMGLQLLSWDYPQKEGLKDLIERSNIHPITILNSLTKKEKQALLKADIVHCGQLLNNQKVLEELHFNHSKKRNILSELDELFAEQG